jgi:hypothetical protein
MFSWCLATEKEEEEEEEWFTYISAINAPFDSDAITNANSAI